MRQRQRPCPEQRLRPNPKPGARPASSRRAAVAPEHRDLHDRRDGDDPACASAPPESEAPPADSRVGTEASRAALFEQILDMTERREAFSPLKESALDFSPLDDMRALRDEFVTRRYRGRSLLRAGQDEQRAARPSSGGRARRRRPAASGSRGQESPDPRAPRLHGHRAPLLLHRSGRRLRALRRQYAGPPGMSFGHDQRAYGGGIRRSVHALGRALFDSTACTGTWPAICRCARRGRAAVAVRGRAAPRAGTSNRGALRRFAPLRR